MRALEEGVCSSDALAEKPPDCNPRKVLGLAFEMSQVSAGPKGREARPRHRRSASPTPTPSSLTLCCPGARCLKVVAREMGGTTASELHCSGSCPTWIACVAKCWKGGRKPELLFFALSILPATGVPGERRETGTRELQEDRMGSDRSGQRSDSAGAISRRVAPLPARSGWQDQLP